MSLEYKSTKKNKDGSVTTSTRYSDRSGRDVTTRNGKTEKTTRYPGKK